MERARENAPPGGPRSTGEQARHGRRSVLGAGLAATLALAGATAASAPPARAATSPIPTLPGEVARGATRTTRLGRVPFETIDVVLGADTARLHVPWTSALKGAKPGGMLWFYHSNGSDHTALDGAYSYGSMLAMDRGATCVCPGFGSTSPWPAAAALEHQVAWSRWVGEVFSVGRAFARANSGGGPLMAYAYARNMVPAQRGMYLANAGYDMEDLYARAPGRVGPVYGGDTAAIAATNPARLPAQVWAGKRIKVVTSPQDPVVPAALHGLALAATARPVAADVRSQEHDQGHVVPGWTQKDMITTFSAWT